MLKLVLSKDYTGDFMKKLLALPLVFLIAAVLCTGVFASGYTKIPSISKAAALEISRNYIKQNAPEVSEQIDFTDNYSISYNKTEPYGYNISYTRMIFGIPYESDSVSLFVDAASGSVLNFYINFDETVEMPDSYPLISQESAKEKFISSMGLELKYNKKITDSKASTYLTYAPSEDFIVNAVTGNIIVLHESLPEDGYFDVTEMAAKSSVYFDTEPDAASISEADSIARSIGQFELSSDFLLVSADFLKDSGGTYLISMNYESDYGSKLVTLDAVNRIPVEYKDFSETSADSEIQPRNSEAEQLASELYGEYLDNMILHTDARENYTIYLWERTVDGIPYSANGLYISYSNSGRLNSLSFCHDKTEFDSKDDVIDIKYAYNSFFATCGLELAYYKRPNNTLIPVYKISASGTGIIDAKTGRQLNYDGTPYYPAKELKYEDSGSHYSAYAALALADCDIYASSGTVRLGDPITQKEFLLLMSELITDTKPVIDTTGVLTDSQCEMLYRYMFQNKVLTEDEAGYNSKVTRADAVKYMLRILGYGTVGDMNEIFIKHFNDYYAIPQEYIGYIELARSLGIVRGDTYGKFNPKDPITNGDSLIMLYNFLRNESN